MLALTADYRRAERRRNIQPPNRRDDRDRIEQSIRKTALRAIGPSASKRRQRSGVVIGKSTRARSLANFRSSARKAKHLRTPVQPLRLPCTALRSSRPVTEECEPVTRGENAGTKKNRDGKKEIVRRLRTIADGINARLAVSARATSRLNRFGAQRSDTGHHGDDDNENP